MSAGLQQAYLQSSTSWQAVMSLLYKKSSVWSLMSRPCCKYQRSLIRICRYSVVNFLGFLLIIVHNLIVFHWVRILRLYSGPLKQLCVALHSLLKGILRGLLLRLVQQWLSTRPHSMVKQAQLNSYLGISAFQQRSIKIVSLKLKLSFLPLYLDSLV